MKETGIAPAELAKAFNGDVDTLAKEVEKFLESSDVGNTQSMRRATRRLRTAYGVLPKGVRKESRVKSYLSATGKLARATGKVRDLDTILAWTNLLVEGKDRRSFASDVSKLRASTLRDAIGDAKKLRKTEAPRIKAKKLDGAKVEERIEKVEKRLARRVDQEFEEFLTTQEVDVMHGLRKDAKRLRHLLELTQKGQATALLARLQSIQDDLGAIRDHDLVIDYLRGRVRLMSTGSLVREEIARRHAKLEEFLTKNRGRDRLVPVSAKGMVAT